MKCTYLINMDDGRLEFRDEYTEKQVNMEPIPDDVKDMILRGEVMARDVIDAISAKIKESGDFNIQEYLDGMKELNVRKSNKQIAPVHDELPEVKDAISVEEVKASAAKSAKDATPIQRSAKRERIRKINEKLDETPAEEKAVEAFAK